jgi:hypothetical protein
MFDGVLKHRAGPTKTVAGIEQAIDLRSVPRPLFDLVEIAQVGDQRIGSLFVQVNVIGFRIGHGPIIDPRSPYRVRWFVSQLAALWTIAVVLASMTAMAIATWLWRWMVGR